MESFRIREVMPTAIPGLAAVIIFILCPALGRAGKPQSALPTLTPQELRTYQKAHTVIDWAPKEIRGRKELKGLQPAETQQDLAKILQEVGARVATFARSLQNTAAMESVQWKLDNPSAPGSYREIFRYWLMRGSAEDQNTLQEYRTDVQGKALHSTSENGESLLTTGFTLTLLLFEPHNQAACRYRYLGRQALGDHQADVVGFAQIPGGSVYLSSFNDGSRTIPLLFQGLAWFDSSSHEILRLQSDLLAPPPHAPLVKQTTQIDFAPVHLLETPATFMLPQKVVVDAWQVVTAMPAPAGGTESTMGAPRRGAIEAGSGEKEYRLHCRSIHSYSDYKLSSEGSHSGPTS